jgi:dTDP-4-amino-4,6-dideoxygalactose transaminase
MLEIPFNKPTFVGNEISLMAQTIKNGHAAGDGPFSQQVEQLLAELSGCRHAFLVPSCTAALEMTALLLNVGPGDEVVLPSFTFVSTVNAYVLRGAKPVFVDVRPDTLNINEQLLEECLTDRTRAIVVVHYAGVGCQMDHILEVARSRNIPIIEDNAHGFMGTWRGRPLGSFGDMATLSFHETKNFTCGEGGALLLREDKWAERARVIRAKGTNRHRFIQGFADKYTWVDLGSSYVLPDLLSAFLWAQLNAREAIQQKRAILWHRYARELATWARAQGVRLPIVPEECVQAYHLFYLLMPDEAVRRRFIYHMSKHQCVAVFHYQPLHQSEMEKRWGLKGRELPETDRVAGRLVRLPFYTSMTETEQDQVLEAVQKFIV